MGHTSWTAAKLNSRVVLPALRDIADVLIADMKQQFSGARRYTGAMESGFARHDAGASSVAVTQSATHEVMIREGTAGPYKGFPRPVVAWALFRGYSLTDSFKIAESIKKNGTAKSFVPLHPGGEPRFEYVEWAINEHAKDMDAWGRRIGKGTVTYITTGNAWRKRSIG